MNIFSDPEKLSFFFDHHSFVCTLKERTNAFVFLVEVHGITSGERAHKASHRIAFDGPQHQVKMVGHKTVGD